MPKTRREQNQITVNKIGNFIDRLQFLRESKKLHNRVRAALELPALPATNSFSVGDDGVISALIGEVKTLIDQHEEFVDLWRKITCDYPHVIFNPNPTPLPIPEVILLKTEVDCFLDMGTR